MRIHRHWRVENVIWRLRGPLLFEILTICFSIPHHFLQQLVQLVLQSAAASFAGDYLAFQLLHLLLQSLYLMRRNPLNFILPVGILRVLCHHSPLNLTVILLRIDLHLPLLQQAVLELPLEPLQTVRVVQVCHFISKRKLRHKDGKVAGLDVLLGLLDWGWEERVLLTSGHYIIDLISKTN